MNFYFHYNILKRNNKQYTYYKIKGNEIYFNRLLKFV